MFTRKLQLTLSLFIFIGISNINAQFITTWRTTTANELITIPTDNSSVNYDINWVEDGNLGNNGSTTGVTGTQSISLPTAGTYRITLSPNFKRIYFNNGGDKDKILTVERWGTAEWVSMSSAFYGCSNLTITAADTPDLSIVTSMYSMFKECTSFNQDISSWDVSNVTSMREMFSGAEIFNQTIDSWVISNVVDVRYMFLNCRAFNKPLGAWDVSNVQYMSGMFLNASSFNQPLDQWGTKTGNVIHMGEMFYGSTAFNKPLGNWDVGLVENMYRMFYRASVFNEDISSWNVINVTNMSEMFYDCHEFNQPLNQWGTKTKKVTTMHQMFRNALKFNQPIDGWDVSSVTTMTLMFYNALEFNQSLNLWGNKTSNVTTMQGMFSNAKAFNGDINLWDVSSVKNMSSMFLYASNFNKPLDNWNVINVENMSFMFGFARAFDKPIGTWNVSNVTNMRSLFRGASAFNKEIGTWIVSNVTNMSLMFFGAVNFNQNINGWNVQNVVDMLSMFNSARSFNQPLNQWGNKTSNVTRMTEMFRNAYAFNQNINDWEVSSVTQMNEMFYSARTYNQPMDKWNVSSVTNMDRMFYRATNFDQDLGGWNVSNVTNMRNMLLSTSLSTTNYDKLLIGWNNLPLQNNISINVTPATYCIGERARQNIINNFNWTFIDGGPRCSEAFITTWDTSLGTNNTQITIPTDATSSNYNIGWEQIGNVTNNGLRVSASGLQSITVTPGKYKVKILGDFQRINFNNSGDKDKLLTVEQWGTKIQWNSMANAFYGCSNLTTVPPTESPDLTNVTNMSHMFHSATQFNSSINHWDVSNVTDMQSLFHGASIYNQPLNSWIVNKVTDMRYMFTECTVFNQPLSSWNVSEVTGMRGMFWAARAFNRPLSNWNLSKVTSTRQMFADATAFDQDISSWDVSSVIQADNMLDNTALSIANYDKLLIEWDKRALQNGVVLGATGLKYCLGKNSRENMITTDNWTINDAGTECSGAFITTWDTENPGSPPTQFIIPTDGTSANYNIKWEEINNTTNFGTRLGVNRTQYIFPIRGKYRVHITGDFKNIYFNNGGDRRKILTVEQWGTDIKWNSMLRAFKGCENLTIPATDMPDLSGATSMQEMFFGATSLNNSLNHWVVTTITNMRLLFYEASAFNQDLGNWDVNNVTNMAGMFTRASAFNSPLNWGNKTSNVTDMNHMFANATAFNQDISGWNVSSVNDMTGMLHKATAFNQPIGNWGTNTGNVTDMKWMLEDATSFDQNISSWDVSNVTNMTRFLNNAGLSIENYDNLLIEWNKQALQKNVTYSALGLQYCKGRNARADMAANTIHAWTMTGDVEACPDISVYDGPNDTSPIILDAQPEAISYGELSGGQTTTSDITKTFTIKNVGVGELSLYSISISGTTYKVNNPPTSTTIVAPSNVITFTITLPSGSGVNTETVTIRSYDEDEDPFTFIVSNDTALPITLSSFSGYVKYGTHILEWVTSSEIDNDYFMLERSANGLDYEVLKTIDGNGTTSVEQRYQSIDSDPFIGKNYYRLRQVDMDGTTKQAGDVVLLTNKSPLGNFGIVVFPNPTDGTSINISLSSSDTQRDLQVRIMDIQGREFFHKVYDTMMLNRTIAISTNSHLENGLYIIEFEQGDQIMRKKVIVKD